MRMFRAPCEMGNGEAGTVRGAVPCSEAAGPWVLAATILASGMAFLDGTAVNVALPALQAGLGARSAKCVGGRAYALSSRPSSWSAARSATDSANAGSS